MLFHKSFEGIIFNHQSKLSLKSLEVALNGYILIHKNKDLIAFTNTIGHSNLFFEDNQTDYQLYFKDPNSYDIQIIKNGKHIENPSEKDFEFVEDNKCFVRYSKIIKLLKEKGFKKTVNITELAV